MTDHVGQHAIAYRFGTPSDIVRHETHAYASPAPNDVLIRMRYATSNPSDLITLSGEYRARIQLPFVPGFEGVGKVVACGENVTSLAEGMRVWPIGSAGSWQTYKGTSADWCFPVPDDLSDIDAASAYINPMTAWYLLEQCLSLRPGMRLVINAAGSAIGQMLIRLCNAHGITPIAMVRSEAAAARLEGLAVEALWWQDKLLPACAPVDAVLDCVGGEVGLTLLAWLKPRGHYLHYGLLSGTPLPRRFWEMRRDRPYQAVHLKQWMHQASRDRLVQAFAWVADKLRTGLIYTTVGEIYPFASLHKALRETNSLTGRGKVMLNLE